MRRGHLRAIALAFMLFPSAAFAHQGAPYVHGFAGGLAHPFAGADHILAMVTVGILAWQLGGRAICLVPATFVLLMGAGGALAMASVALPRVEIAIAASVIVFGTLVALNLRAPLAVAAGCVALFAVFHGHAHGSEMPIDLSTGAYAAGFILATALLHGAGMALGWATSRIGGQHSRLAYALGGGTIALAGLRILANAI
jgi:urease accessory protein